MKVRVSKVNMEPGSTIVVGEGTDERGDFVRFGGDWRAMYEIVRALAVGEDVQADVPEWAVIEREVQS